MKKKLPIIIVVIAVVAAFAVYWFVIKPMNEPPAEDVPQEVKMEDIYYYPPGEYFVTNIKDSLALAKTSTSLALTGEDKTPFLETNNAVIRNAIIKVLISHTEDELRTPEAINMLEKEMAEAVRAALQLEDELYNVYISDFVIQ